MFELFLAGGLLLSITALTLVLRALAPRLHQITASRSVVQAPIGAEAYGDKLVETYLGYRQ